MLVGLASNFKIDQNPTPLLFVGINNPSLINADAVFDMSLCDSLHAHLTLCQMSKASSCMHIFNRSDLGNYSALHRLPQYTTILTAAKRARENRKIAGKK
jgi:hypothetical protein